MNYDFWVRFCLKANYRRVETGLSSDSHFIAGKPPCPPHPGFLKSRNHRFKNKFVFILAVGLIYQRFALKQICKRHIWHSAAFSAVSSLNQHGQNIWYCANGHHRYFPFNARFEWFIMTVCASFVETALFLSCTAGFVCRWVVWIWTGVFATFSHLALV